MKPIIFSTEMVRAILDGRKSITRRVVTPQPVIDDDKFWQWKDCQWGDRGLGMPQSGIDDYAPYQPGDILWVRETWQCVTQKCENLLIGYAASGIQKWVPFSKDKIGKFECSEDKWRPSIHMPREAARIFLEVKSVRIEQLMCISEQEAQKEGAIKTIILGKDTYISNFRYIWDTINAKRGFGWFDNPWVWVYEFERVEVPNA